MNILGIKVTNHDTGAALIADNQIVAIAEERLNRVKHSRNMFPALSIDYCLKALNVNADDIDLIVLDQVRYRDRDSSRRIFLQHVGDRFSKIRIEVVNHHDAHAAAAFFCSPFNEAAVLIVDGAGESIRDHSGVMGTETETIYRGTGNTLNQVLKTTHMREMLGFPHTIGIGKLYSFISDGYLNFGAYNEGKMMGLAPYGSGRVLQEYPLSKWFKTVGDHIVCNPRITFEGIENVRGVRQKYGLRGRFLWLWNELCRKAGYSLIRAAYRNREPSISEPKIFERIRLGGHQRGKRDPLPQAVYADAAFAVQKVLEEVMVAWGRKLRAITGCDDLCVAGGVGLNIDANRRFLDDVGFKHLFVQPAASDTGIALGCALWGAHQILGLPRFYEMKSASLGRVYSEKEIILAIEDRKDEISFGKSSDVAGEAAKLISSGKIIGWFQGGAEYGPRALGNRSILCDARNPEMVKIVNEKVKHRELWRPFAASVLAEKQREWFELDHPSPFMLLAAQVVEEKKKLVLSVVHVDGTCRIQSVTAEANKTYYELLKEFDALTGVPLVLNTSFNDAGEPIVETPSDALRCFLNTKIDYLVLNDYIVSKK